MASSRAYRGISLGLNRRDFLRASAAVPAAGAFSYLSLREFGGSPVRAGIVGTGNEGCAAMIAQSPPEFLRYVAYHDIRPSQIKRARKKFLQLYGSVLGNEENVVFHDSWKKMLDDPKIEVIVIATPLWTHAQLAVDAMLAGKHVFCEKLMAHNITDAKAMIRLAEKKNLILAIGHQRHYSRLYDDAVRTIESGTLGEIKHIRAFWHRNNTHQIIDPKTKEMRIRDSWNPRILPEDEGSSLASHADQKYKNVRELVCWRLFDRTGGGLMAELGSHQLDACSIFLSHTQPLSVTGVGSKYYYDDDRDCEDHVYCTFEFPDGRIVTFSSINTNSLEGYGEIVMGTHGTLMISQEREMVFFEETAHKAKDSKDSKIDVKTGEGKKDESSMYSAASTGLAQEGKSLASEVSRGYKEELEHFAFCVRHRDPRNKVRCDGRVGLADAVMALAANVAMREQKRIEFKDEWFDPDSEMVPDKPPEDLSLKKTVDDRVARESRVESREARGQSRESNV